MTTARTWIHRREARWNLPGRLYDLAFGGILRSVRRSVAATVTKDGLYPWLDVCCGTGNQLRGIDREPDGRTAIGLDLHPGMIRYAAARAPRCAFVRGDAAVLPFKTGVFRAVSATLGLHDKDPGTRTAMMEEAKRVLARGGRFVAVDFETPRNTRARIGALFARAIERTAGGSHYRNGRGFLRRGGLEAFLREHGFIEIARRDIAIGSISVVVSRIES
jgi:ubiquinone/menaquinone biosynthesis C-methylase UbiE